MNEPDRIQFHPKTWDAKASPVDPTQLLLTLVLTATTSLSAAEVEIIKDRILKEGLRVYVVSDVETEMLAAMRLALLRAEDERNQSRTRANHFEGEYQRAQARIAALEAELTDKRKTLSFLEKGLNVRPAHKSS